MGRRNSSPRVRGNSAPCIAAACQLGPARSGGTGYVLPAKYNGPLVPHARCAGPMPISRRSMLQIGGISLMGLGLPRLLRAETQSVAKPKADACQLTH